MEFIGDLIALVLLTLVAIVVGAILALTAWLLLRKHRQGNDKLVFFAGLLPAASLLYIIVFSILWAVLVPASHSVFPGDMDEPLPNGYTLKGLDKMPDYSVIEPVEGAHGKQGFVNEVASIGILGETVYGSLRPGSQPNPTDPAFFGFDTNSGTVRHFATQADLNRFAGHPISLMETSQFTSQDSVVRFLRRLEGLFDIGVPLLALVTIFVRIFRLRKERAHAL